MPFIDFLELRLRVRLVDVFALIHYQPTWQCGDQVRGPCPVHRSTSKKGRSFSANLRRGIWNCFKCGSHGNAVDLFARVRQLSPYRAAIELCRELQMEVPIIPK